MEKEKKLESLKQGNQKVISSENIMNFYIFVIIFLLVIFASQKLLGNYNIIIKNAGKKIKNLISYFWVLNHLSEDLFKEPKIVDNDKNISKSCYLYKKSGKNKSNII